MTIKELIFRVDTNILAMLEQEMQNKRNNGAANSVGDKVLIRLLEALKKDTKAILFKSEKNKFTVRSYDTLNYDNDRQTRTENRKVDGTGEESQLPV